MRLIDADALCHELVVEMVKCVRMSEETKGSMAERVLNKLDEAPAVDAVEVVRCAKCEKRDKSADLTDSIYCRWLKCQMRKNDFCSYGERREDEA